MRVAARLDPLSARGRHAQHVARDAAERIFSRFKRVLGGVLRSRGPETRRAEVALAVGALNRMAEIGLPRARRFV